MVERHQNTGVIATKPLGIDRGGDIAVFPRLDEAIISDPLHAIESRVYQHDAWAAIAEARAGGSDRALVHMATGLGKTTVAAVDALRYIKEHPGAKGLFLAHTNEIVDQARERFSFFFGDSHTTGAFREGKSDVENPDFLFSTLQTMKDRTWMFDSNTFDYVVVDESHHGKADTFEKTIVHFEPKFLLGITATPDRVDLRQIRELFGYEVYSKTLAEALAEGLLAKVDYRIVMDDIVRDALDRDFRSIAEVNHALFVPKRNEEVANIIGDHMEEVENPKTIVFCKSIAAAKELAEYMPDAVILHSNLSQNQRKRVLQQFRGGVCPHYPNRQYVQ